MLHNSYKAINKSTIFPRNSNIINHTLCNFPKVLVMKVFLNIPTMKYKRRTLGVVPKKVLKAYLLYTQQNTLLFALFFVDDVLLHETLVR